MENQLIEDNEDDSVEIWTPLSVDDLAMFGTSDDSRDNTNWDALDYTSRDINWYRERFGGFGDDILEILAQCDGTSLVKDKNGKNHYERAEELAEELADELKKRLTVKFD